MQTRIQVDGHVTAPEEARIPVLDHGFLFGDSVYEVFWWHHGALIQEQDHLARLERSAGRLYMDVQVPREELVRAMQDTVRAAGAGPQDDAYVRLIVTRGSGPLGLSFGEVPRRSVVVIAAPANRPTPTQVERGVHVALVERERMSVRALDPGAKTGNYLNNVLALHEARMAGADDAIMLNARGEVTEATTANVYLVREGRLATPPLQAGILEGTTRRRILGLCAQLGVEAAERSLRPEDLRAAEEVFVSSSVKGILPVTRIDDLAVGSGGMGPVTKRIRERFEAAADEEAARRTAGA
jgi:branched-chain amino acid aminotransferase